MEQDKPKTELFQLPAVKVHFTALSQLEEYVNGTQKLETPSTFSEIQSDYKFLAHRYYLNLKQHITANDFTAAELKDYLLVKSYVVRHLSLNHILLLLGKPSLTLKSKEIQDQLQEVFNKYQQSQSNLLAPNNQTVSEQEKNKIKIISDKLTVSSYQYNALKNASLESEDFLNYGFFFFQLDSARITNLAIDQIVASKTGTRDVTQTYPSKFYYYYHTDIKEDSQSNYEKYLAEIKNSGFSSLPITFQLSDQQVYSNIPNIDMNKLQSNAGYSDEAKNNAAKVAAVLAQDNINNGANLADDIQIDLSSTTGAAQVGNKNFENFLAKYYQHLYNPSNKAPFNVSFLKFPLFKAYVEAQLNTLA